MGRRGFASWHATRRSITLGLEDSDGHPDRLFFTLSAPKTDPSSQGITISIAALGDRLCAVSAPRILLTRWPSPPDTLVHAAPPHQRVEPQLECACRQPPYSSQRVVWMPCGGRNSGYLLWSLFSPGSRHFSQKGGRGRSRYSAVGSMALGCAKALY